MTDLVPHSPNLPERRDRGVIVSEGKWRPDAAAYRSLAANVVPLLLPMLAGLIALVITGQAWPFLASWAAGLGLALLVRKLRNGRRK